MYKSIALAAAVGASTYSIFYPSSPNSDIGLDPNIVVDAKGYEQQVNEHDFDFEEHFVTT